MGSDATTGVQTIYPVSAPAYWTGLAAGAVPKDVKQPRLSFTKPRHDTVSAWRTVKGKVSDPGGSGVRYVAVAAFQKRGSSWWAWVGTAEGQHWSKYPTRNEARYAARERTARIVDGRWSVVIRGLVPGRLVLGAKSADNAGNGGRHNYAVTITA